jgi:hypothetical protein
MLVTIYVRRGDAPAWSAKVRYEGESEPMSNSADALPDDATLGQLRNQAKDLRLGVINGRPEARVRASRIAAADPETFSIRDAQTVVAREYGFDRWQDVVTAFGNRQPRQRDLHRWFAIELNNELGDLLFELSPRTPRAEQDQALYQAYAACYHWLQAGTVANHARAEYAIAWTALAIGRPHIAAAHCARYAELIAEHPDAFTDWDRALSAEVLARTGAATGAPDARDLKAHAEHLADQVEDPEARAVVVERLGRQPWFGLA